MGPSNAVAVSARGGETRSLGHSFTMLVLLIAVLGGLACFAKKCNSALAVCT